jgi:hypothetical protein
VHQVGFVTRKSSEVLVVIYNSRIRKAWPAILFACKTKERSERLMRAYVMSVVTQKGIGG